MDDILKQSQLSYMDKAGDVVLDIECLTHPADKCSGSPQMTKALSRKGSCRMERRSSEEQEADESSKKLVVKVFSSQVDQLKQPLLQNKAMIVGPPLNNTPSLNESGEGRNKRFDRLTMHPRKILLFFATMSSMGTMILIYFTLTINWRGGA